MKKNIVSNFFPKPYYGLTTKDYEKLYYRLSNLN